MTSSSGLKKRFEAETLPLFPVRVRRLVSDHRVGVCRSSAGGEGGGSQDRTVPRLLLPRPFTLQLCGGQKRSLPPPPPPRATSPQPRFKETQLRRSGPNNGGTSTWWGLRAPVETTALTPPIWLSAPRLNVTSSTGSPGLSPALYWPIAV